MNTEARLIIHIDLNAFFMTCEEINNPSLVGKIAAVGGIGKRGIILSANYAARAKGIRAAMPTYKAVEMYKNLIVVSPHYHLYKRYSNLFFDYVKKYLQVEEIEITSIDEGYIDMTEILNNVADKRKFLTDFQTSIFANTGLKCSIGLGETRFAAKMGSDYKKPMGVTVILKEDIKEILFPLPIESMLGIGKKTAPKLHGMGINTIGDLYNTNNPEVKAYLGTHFDYIKRRLEGKGNDIISTDPIDPKSIGHSSTFLNDTNDFEEIKAMIISLSKEVAERLKKEKQYARTIQIVIKDANFQTTNRSQTVNTPFSDFDTISFHALSLFDRNYHNQYIRLVGVTAQNLSPAEETIEQLSLFVHEEKIEEDKTKLLLNDLNKKIKSRPLIRASELKKGTGK